MVLSSLAMVACEKQRKNMSTEKTKTTPVMEFRTKPFAGATHVIDDVGMVYWVDAGGAAEAQIEAAFRAGYDGDPGEVKVESAQ